jgi:hypothetical protein
MSNPPVISALPVSGLITNLTCDDGSLDLSNPQGNQVVIRAKVIAAESATPPRSIGTVYTNGLFLRQVYASFHLEANVGSPATGPTLTYNTVTGGVSVSAPFATLDGKLWSTGGGIIIPVTFPVDAEANYSVSASLGNGTVTIASWLEVDVT